MILSQQQIQAIYQLYSSVVTIRGTEAFDTDGNQVQYNLQDVTEQAQKNDCKAIAKVKLTQTDWAVLPDVGLANQDAFVFYRLNLRNLVRNPVTNPVWEDEPQPVWSNV